MQGIRESAGWGPASWWPRSNFVEFKDTNRSPSFSGNWRRCFPLGRRLSNGERHRRVGYARAATFHGVSGDPLLCSSIGAPYFSISSRFSVSKSLGPANFAELGIPKYIHNPTEEIRAEGPKGG